MVMFVFIIMARSDAQERPNIVLIFIDDWGWNGTPMQMDESVPNSMMPLLEMPNLEKLADRGMKFQNAYAGAPQCAPSRVALQTGQSSPRSGFTVYMNNHGSEYFDHNPDYSGFPVVACISDRTIDEEAVTIPEALKPFGYVSAHIGKWHMRGDPGDEGYAVHDGATTNKPGNSGIPGDPKLMFSITEKAIGFMEEQVAVQNPFYLQISHYAMHKGYECLAETREKYAQMPELQEYYRKVGETAETIQRRHRDPASWMAMGEDLDGRIGAVLDKIAELGIDDNTYVVFASDNGYRRSFYSSFGLTQPLHGGKWWLWQGGLRVPMIVAGPGIRSGSVCYENVVNYDFLPTFVEWAGGDSAALQDVDGLSIAGLLRGEKQGDLFRNRSLYFHYPHYRSAMPVSAMVSGSKKVMHFYERPDIPMLFDLSVDRGEVNNIAEKQPAVHDELHDRLMRYLIGVNARFPVENPGYDSAAYQEAEKGSNRAKWGPFKGSRSLEADEK